MTAAYFRLCEPRTLIKTMPKKIDVLITYLEQTERPAPAQASVPAGKLAILRAQHAPVHFYRYIHEKVGDPHKWVSRKIMDDEAIAKIIHDPNVYLYIFYVDGVPAGLAEIDAREAKIAEIKFFGLVPDFVGRGLGRYFLSHAIDLAWSLHPERVRLETCTLDHPAALPLYQKLGFTVFDQRKGQVELPDDATRQSA